MIEYTIRRLLWFIPIIFIVVTALFLILQVVPGDPIRAAFGSEIPLSPERIAAMRAELGLDKPVWLRYLDWLWNLLHFNLGISFFSGATVVEQLVVRIPMTAGLILLSMIFMIVLSIPCGILSGYYHDKWPDWITRTISILFISLPHFWVAVMVVLILLTVWGWFPPIKYATLFSDPLTAIQQIALPAFIMALRPFGIATRLIRSSMVEVFEEDFIRTARAKGLTEKLMTLRHALPNSLIPVTTFYGLEFIVMVGAVVVMEDIFSIPGVGSLIVQAANNRDLYVLQGCVLLLLFFALFVNLGIDLLYAKLDPRIRLAK